MQTFPPSGKQVMVDHSVMGALSRDSKNLLTTFNYYYILCGSAAAGTVVQFILLLHFFLLSVLTW